MSINVSPAIFYIVSVVLVGGVLLDMHFMSSPKTAVLGNKIGAASMLLAIVLTLLYYEIASLALIAIFLLLGSAIGLLVAVKVKMIHMPQTVALLHCGGAGAAVLVAMASVLNGDVLTAFSRFTSILALVVGGLTFSGSLVAGGKLSGVMKGKPVIYPGHSAIFFAVAALMAVGCVASIFFELTALYLLVVLVLSLFFGYWFAIRIGGADMPITISLLNSFSGVAGGIAGMAISEPLLVAIGGVIGAAGLILTQIMCRAMNRHLWDILTGKTSAPTVAKTLEAFVEPPVSAPAAAVPQNDVKSVIAAAKTVIVVPGYGLALAQAQHTLKSLCDYLEEQGKEVLFAIHPVAGRMPGHMNVLLAEADISYDKLIEMDEINPRFPETDLVLVVGSNDVINPAAHTAEGTPIYGMPILNVEEAKNIIICNFDTKPGYAGVDNPLYKNPKSIMMLGDAQKTLQELLDTARGTAPAAAAAPQNDLAPIIAAAKTVIVVPGYGMALAQAQHLVKTIGDKLEEQGKQVLFAIHPVAGRMPGHMNVLLAEAGVDYEKMLEMDEINERFPETDLALVVGSNDVINPAAHTAEGTPIYGMPILNVEAAKHIVICNYDTKPGYAGVDNPLYQNPKSIMMLGDAQETLQSVLAAVNGEVAAAPAAPAQASGVDLKGIVDAAKTVIVVPGYGMALAQAQHQVKAISDKLEERGKEVLFAIHPVAGRMPGHMNVLLAEAGVDYEKLLEMDEINERFPDADLALVVGSNDVINPAAHTAEGTPIYGMPILNVEEAKHIIICNYDTKPGYAGVDNPLYQSPKATLLLGDAQETLRQLQAEAGL